MRKTSLSTFFGIASLLLLAFVAINSVERNFSTDDEGSSESGYPAPITSGSSDPYPAPIPNTPENLSVCEGVGQSITYTDSELGFSFDYPAEANLSVSQYEGSESKSISVFLKPECQQSVCHGSNRIVISLMPNPTNMPVEEFVNKEFTLATNPPKQDSMANLEKATSVVVGDINGIRIEDGITFNNPDIFAPIDNYVVRIYVAAESPVPPHDPPCADTLMTLDNLLSSFKQ